jgi:tetratricopeptide (TPR) repeat protein
VVGVSPIVADRHGPLFGRFELKQRLRQTLADVKDGEGRLVLLEGEAGVGRTTLLRAAVQDALAQGFQVLEGRALPSDLPQPFALIQDLVRAARADRSARAASPSGSVLPLFLAPVEIDGEAGPEPSLPTERRESIAADRLLSRLTGPPERVEESRIHLLDQISEYFLGLARQAPLLLAVDDVHFADESSVEFLRGFATSIARSRVAILAASATEEGPDAEASVAIEPLLKVPGVTRLVVRRMTEPELAEFTRWLLRGRDPGRDAVMRWYTQTDGNPLFAEHLIRGSVGVVGSMPEEPTNTTQDLDEVLREHVRTLSDEDRRVLVYGSVLGKEFDFRALKEASQQDEESLSESLDRLVHLGLVREKGGEVYEFVRERARAEAYAQLTETRRRILHRKVAQALAARGGRSPTDVYELARQFYLGRDDEKAVEYNRRAAELATRAYAYDTAVVHLERALECARRVGARDPVVELHVLVDLGRVLEELGDFKRSDEVLADAVARARQSPEDPLDLALAILWHARTRVDLGEYTSARELGEEALRLFERLENRQGMLGAHRWLGVAFWRLADLERAEEHQRAELTIAETIGDPWERGHALIDLANTFTSQGASRTAEALELYDTAARLFATTSDHAAQSRVLMNRSLLYHHAGRMQEAMADLTLAIEAAERSRARVWIGYCRLNEAQFRAELHDPAGARVAIERTAQLLEPLGDRLAMQQITMIRGMIEEEEGALDRAEATYRDALQQAEALSLGGERSEMFYRLARLSHRRGAEDVARQHLRSAHDARVLELRGELATQIEDLERELAGAPSG